MKLSKILIIRFSSIGDIVLTTPVIRCLKQLTGAEIHFLVKPAFANVIRTNPYIDRCFTLNDSLSETISELKKENYDLIVDLHKNLRSFRISLSLGIKTIRYDKLNFKKWLFVHFKKDLLPKNKHLVDRYFDALQQIGVTNDGYGLDYTISKEDEDKALQMIQDQSYQILVLGATYYTKRIPQEKCQEIITKYTGITYLVGGNDVKELSENLTSLYADKVVNTCGNISLGVSAALIKYSQLVFTGDTGMMHIAAALQKEMIVIWGNTVPQFGMYPYYGHKNKAKHINKEVLGLSCRPCSKLGFDHCPKGHFKCMRDLEI